MLNFILLNLGLINIIFLKCLIRLIFRLLVKFRCFIELKMKKKNYTLINIKLKDMNF